ncbi:MAG: glycoside hydrolase family 3 N-terminal domain-containing protein, partial [Rhodocyclaceae bacterium]
MIDIAGTELSSAERERLSHPLVGGVILFARNYRDPDQLSALCAEIHALRDPPLLIAIDHEGGRVQRCREGFTVIPAMRRLGEWWDRSPHAAVETTRMLGYLLAAELRACGVDLSFTPVLDLDYGVSSVIG